MAEIEGQGHLSSTKQTACILTVRTNYSEDFCPNLTEIHSVSPNCSQYLNDWIELYVSYTVNSENF